MTVSRTLPPSTTGPKKPAGASVEQTSKAHPAQNATPSEKPTEPLDLVFRNLRSTTAGLTNREAARRLITDGPNQLSRRGKRRWPADLLAQFTQPLALLLVAAAILAAVSGSVLLAIAIVAVIALNAVFAFFQEQHAEHAVEALAAYLPSQARVVRDGAAQDIEATTLVPGDVLIVQEGDRISADARLISGSVEVDLSTLTGESQPVTRTPGRSDIGVALLQAENMLFSGSAAIAGDAQAVVTATGMHTEIGRIAALSERVGGDSSPLENQVRKVAKLIAVVSIVVAIAFLPLGLAAGLSTAAAISFAIGMLVANVPEGLLPTITLALAAGVQTLAKKGAVVKRLSAVETLGCTTVICTDKTGTLTQNRMQVTDIWTFPGAATCDADDLLAWPENTEDYATSLAHLVIATAGTASTAEVTATGTSGDPTEIAVVKLSAALQQPTAPPSTRQAMFRFDPRLRMMTTVDLDGEQLWVNSKGAPEAVLAITTELATDAEHSRPITAQDRADLAKVIDTYGRRGLRLIAVARRPVETGGVTPTDRKSAERDLCLLGIIAMLDPPRTQAKDAIDRAHQAGIRVLVVTGDNGTTATEIARQVGIGTGPAGSRTITGDQPDKMTEAQLDEVLQSPPEIVFARSSPEAKLRIADALRSLGEVVAMTGDGVNDAPALRAADIGVAMGRSGTEVARQAATMVLTDDNFATIIDAVEEGRRVYDNVRKFILYIFTHAVPEIAPFLIFALSGGAVPLPLTVMQLLAIDLLTDTLPALALSREPAEPGTMQRPPRPTSEGVIRPSLLARAWGFLGVISAALVLAGFFIVLHEGGWHLHAATGNGAPLHHLYRQATTIAWLGIVACQIGTAFAARTDRSSLWRTGLTTNPLLLAGIGVELILAAGVIYLPFLHPIFGTAAPTAHQLVLVIPFPFIVWGADETRRWIQRRRHPTPSLVPMAEPNLPDMTATAVHSVKEAA
jgi:calcium-translocating P-type ATPase